MRFSIPAGNIAIFTYLWLHVLKPSESAWKIGKKKWTCEILAL